MDPEAAKKLDPTVAVLVYGQPVEPVQLVHGVKKSEPPTIQNPKEVIDNQHSLIVQMGGIIFYDLADGKVLKRVDL